MFDGAQVNGGSSFVFRGLTLLLLLREPTQIAKCLMAQKTHASRVEAVFAIWVTLLLGDHAIQKMFNGAEDTGLRAGWQCFH